MATVSAVQMTQTPVKLHLIKIFIKFGQKLRFKVSGVAYVSITVLGDILDNSISFVDMFMINKVRATTSEKPLLFTL